MSPASATQASSSLHFGYLSQNSLWNPFTFLNFTISLFLIALSSVLSFVAEKRLWFWRLWVQWVFVPVHLALNYQRNSISNTEVVVFQEAFDYIGCVGIIFVYYISLQPTQHFPPACLSLSLEIFFLPINLLSVIMESLFLSSISSITFSMENNISQTNFGL